ncbi:T9SS type A sorting domain-containing protein [Reichenbachiella sp.]|uniref:T9SS type A sorting domain-containing protein n=1 Tax=Reichenbachiella sp. TaxID=2184521 RepID=UPI003BAF1DCD
MDRFTLYKPGSGARLRDEGVAQEISTINILAYPNPVSYALHLKGLPEGNYSLKMYNLSGSMVLNQEINYVNQFILDVNDLRNGMYVLRVRGGDIDTRLKVKVKH